MTNRAVLCRIPGLGKRSPVGTRTALMIETTGANRRELRVEITSGALLAGQRNDPARVAGNDDIQPQRLKQQNRDSQCPRMHGKER